MWYVLGLSESEVFLGKDPSIGMESEKFSI